MQFSVEQKISNFIRNQFPSFYNEEGENFILFMKAYYEWMESEGNAVGESRNLFNYRDIDNTVDSFLVHFQQKYLYGIPFNVISDKRFLLKHILNVYQSKGNIQSYKLLFKLLYDEEIEVYLPGIDVIKPSDGTWFEGKYIEVSDVEESKKLIGKTIIGITSGVMGIVEAYSKEPINQNINVSLYVSNILPKGGSFIQNEKVVNYEEYTNPSTNATDLIERSPIILGSFNSMEIVNGGQNFRVGDLLKIAQRDPLTNKIVSNGLDAIFRVNSITTSNGNLSFNITHPGFGITSSPHVEIYRAPGDTTGNNASFSVGSLSSVQILSYNTDLICDYLDISLDSLSYGFPANSTANLSSSITSSLAYSSNSFGGLLSLTNIKTGNNYKGPADIFIRSTIDSRALNSPGTITYNSNSKIISGDGTQTFSRYFNSNSNIVHFNSNTTYVKSNGAIILGSNVSLFNVGDIITYVVNYGNTVITGLNNGENYYVYSKNSSAIYLAYEANNSLITSLTAGGDETGHGFVSSIGTCNDMIAIKANNSLSSSIEYKIIKNVIDDNTIQLYDYPVNNSTASSVYLASPAIIPSNYALTETPMINSDGTVNGLNAIVEATPLAGNGVVSTVSLVDSGKGYIDDEFVNAYLYSGLTKPVILNGGSGYSNGEPLIFSGGNTLNPGKATVTTDGSGSIIDINMLYFGSNYDKAPNISVKTKKGVGASIVTTLTEYNTFSQVTGKIKKGGLGKQRGGWTTTRGFLDNDKYIQDSYFYQDFSYQIKAAIQLNKYKDILYNTFHVSGTEMFGQYQLTKVENSINKIVSEYNQMIIDEQFVIPLTVDTTRVTSDETNITSDANSSVII